MQHGTVHADESTQRHWNRSTTVRQGGARALKSVTDDSHHSQDLQSQDDSESPGLEHPHGEPVDEPALGSSTGAEDELLRYCGREQREALAAAAAVDWLTDLRSRYGDSVQVLLDIC